MNTQIKDINDFDNQLLTSGISIPEFLQTEPDLTEDQKAAAWEEFEAQQRELDYENNFYNTYK